MATTKAPSGLSIERNNNSFTFNWKISDNDYNDGQEFNYYFHPEDNNKWGKSGVDSRDTSKSISFNPSSYFPNTKLFMQYVKFRVRGNRTSYTQDNATINPGWSGWTEKKLDISVPNKPRDVQFTLDSELVNVGSFSWKVDDDTSSPKIFTRVQWQSALVEGIGEPQWSSRDLEFRSGSSYDAEGSQEFTETKTPSVSKTYTRWFRIRSQGPRGSSEWTVSKHIWAIPYTPIYTGGSATTDSIRSMTNITAIFNVSSIDGSKPVDSVAVQYSFITPAANLAFPQNGSWSDGVIIRDRPERRQTVQFNVDSVIQPDQCLYIRINSTYDRHTTYGNPILLQKGTLLAPTINSIVPNTETRVAEIRATNNSQVPDSFMVVYYTDSLNRARAIGIIPAGQTTLLSLPFPYEPEATGEYFSIRTVQGSYSVERSVGSVKYYAIRSNMQSSVTTQGGAVPKVPTLTVENSAVDNVARISWNWSWNLAEGITISWAENDYAWESTSSPESHDVVRTASPVLYVDGLDTEKTYYFRARFYNEELNSVGEWSDPIAFVPSSAPLAPNLSLSNSVIFAFGDVEASWTYESQDDIQQDAFELALVTVDSDGRPNTITHYTSGGVANHYTISQRSIAAYYWPFDPGTTVNFAVRMRSANRWSDWSNVVSLTYVYPLSAAIFNDSMVPVSVDDKVFYELSSMPYNITVVGAGEGGVTSMYILRDTDYHVDRPDGKDYDGYAGELIAYKTQVGEAEMTFELSDLYGKLDDGASYTLRVVVSDEYGQSDTITRPFTVRWSHQPEVPEAIVETYTTSMVSTIKVSTPTDYETGDTFDVYRLSSDPPELIIQNGEYETEYVDPYPAFNNGSGYRVVNKTASGDYITADNTFAWADVMFPFIEYYRLVVNFGPERAIFPYNLTFDNTWTKDFKRTEYLGGSVVGDWNPQVTKDISVSTVLIPDMDEDTIALARRLAAYPGVCHVRTPQGNSFSADVQLTESITYDGLLYDYTLEIKKVDGESLDGVTLEDWERDHGPLV